MRKSYRNNILWRYSLSYLLVVLAACLALGMSLMMVTISQLRTTETETYVNRLERAAVYFENQFSAITEMRNGIKAGRAFQPVMLHRSVVNDRDAIDGLERFRVYSAWEDELYLWYLDDQKVYSATATFEEDIFLKYVLGGAERETLCLSEEAGLQFVRIEQRPDAVLVVMPFHFGTYNLPTGRCELICLVPVRDILETLTEMTAIESDAPVELYWMGQPLLHAAFSAETIEGSDPTRRVRIVTELSDFAAFDRINRFESVMLAISLAAIAVGGALALFAAWHSAKPIRNLYEKYVPALNMPARDELETIEKFLQDTLESASVSQRQVDEQLKQLNRQKNYLKQQLVLMLISGNDSPVIRQQIQDVGYQLDRNFFATMFIHLET